MTIVALNRPFYVYGSGMPKHYYIYLRNKALGCKKKSVDKRWKEAGKMTIRQLA